MLLTSMAMRPTALTALRASCSSMSLTYSVSSVAISKAFVSSAMAARMSSFSDLM